MGGDNVRDVLFLLASRSTKLSQEKAKSAIDKQDQLKVLLTDLFLHAVLNPFCPVRLINIPL